MPIVFTPWGDEIEEEEYKKILAGNTSASSSFDISKYNLKSPSSSPITDIDGNNAVSTLQKIVKIGQAIAEPISNTNIKLDDVTVNETYKVLIEAEQNDKKAIVKLTESLPATAKNTSSSDINANPNSIIGIGVNSVDKGQIEYEKAMNELQKVKDMLNEQKLKIAKDDLIKEFDKQILIDDIDTKITKLGNKVNTSMDKALISMYQNFKPTGTGQITTQEAVPKENNILFIAIGIAIIFIWSKK